MKGNIKFWVGDVSEFNLQTRIFHFICLTLVAAGIFGLIINLIIELPFIAILASTGIFILPILYLYLSRFKKRIVLAKVLFIVTSYALIIFFWIYNAGIDGVVVVFFVVLLVWQVIFTDKHHNHWLVFSLLLFNGLLALNYFYPNSIQASYSSEMGRYLDHGFTFSIASFSVFVIVKIMLKSYNNEKQRVIERNEELDRINLKLEENIKKLETLNHTKDKLFSLVSHDMRSFTGNIQNFSYLLLKHKKKLTPETDHLYKVQIYNASKNLDDLMGNMLNWARLQLNSLEPYVKKCHLATAVKVNAGFYAVPLKNKNIDIALNVDDSHYAMADLDMFNSIVRNLISNALKFTPEKGIIEIVSYETTNNQVQLIVSDSGVGMEKEKIEQLLQNESIFSERGTNNEKGSGIGLSLVKDFIEANKGTLQIESKKGKGTKMIVTLPSE